MRLVTLHFMLIRYILHSVNNLFSNAHVRVLWITLVACWLALILVITRNCDATVNSTQQFYLQRSFTLREMHESYFTQIKFLTDPALSVSIIFYLSLALSFSSVVIWAGGMSAMHILLGRMHSCRAQHPVPFVSTSSTSLKLCGTYAAPSFTPPPSFLPFLWASSIFQNLPLPQSGNGARGLAATNNSAQPWPKCSWRFTGCNTIPDGKSFIVSLSFHWACLVLQMEGKRQITWKEGRDTVEDSQNKPIIVCVIIKAFSILRL